MAGLLLIASLAAAADCDPEAKLEEAQTAVLALDLEGGHARLTELEGMLSCTTLEPEQLATFWIVTAALAEFESDATVRDEALLAARNSSDAFWIDAFGDALLEKWAAVIFPAGDGSVQFDDLSDGYEVRVDGVASEAPYSLSPGLHVVQVRGGDAIWGKVVRSSGGDTVMLSTGLPVLRKAPEPVPQPEAGPQPATTVVSREPYRRGEVAGYAAAGFFGQVGGGFTVDGETESGVKAGPLLEVGLALWPYGAWARVAVGVDVAAVGRYLYLDGDYAVQSLAMSPTVTAAAGLSFGDLYVGALTGAQLPLRTQLRAVGGFSLSDRVAIEARLGANLVGTWVQGDAAGKALAFEPAFSALGAFSF